MSEFIHRFEPSPSGSDLTILALHGTGADENDLRDLVRAIAPDAAYLSPRGKSQEEGLNRYFRRFAEGVFDVEDVKRRAMELAEWVAWAREKYDVKKLIALGYSNGANIGTALMFSQPELVDGLIALRGQTPYDPADLKLEGKPVLMINGQTDPIVPVDDVQRLAKILNDAGAQVQHVWLPIGHGLSPDDVKIARDWVIKQG